MEHQPQILEELFRKAYQNHTQVPSPRVLRQLRFRLWVSDFFSFRPKKLNVYYTTLLTGGIVSAIILHNKPDQDIQKSDIQNTASRETNIQKSIVDEKIVESSVVTGVSDKKNTVANSAKMLSASFEPSSLEGCKPLTVLFNDQSVNATNAKWDFGDGNSSTELNPRHTFTKAGKYRVTLNISDNEGHEAKHSKEINVMDRPQAAMEIEMDGSGNSKAVIFKSISKGGTNYIWDFGDNSGAEGENAKHTYSDFGIYYVTLVATAANGCKDTARLNNNFVDKDYELNFPFNFRPNTEGPGNDGYYKSAGSETYIFYPKNFGAQKYELKVYAPSGALVFSTNDISQGWNGYIKGRLVPAGVYLYESKGTYPNGKPFEIKGKVKVIIEDYFQ
jgi:PKD repeat protein